jgi:hypothetical protein
VLDADKLDGIDSTGFLGATAKAADRDKLDGIDSTGFVQGGGTRARSHWMPAMCSNRARGS